MKKIQITTFLFLGLIFLVACQHNEKTNHGVSKFDSQESNKGHRLDSIEPVIIVGSTDDPKAFKYLTFLNHSNFPGLAQNKPDTATTHKNLNLKFDYIETPQIVEIYSLGDSLYRNTRMFVTPGDSIAMALHNKNIVFKGKNAAHYNFFHQMDPGTQEWGLNKFQGNLKEYKKGAEDIHEKRMEFFKDFIANNEVSQEFKTLVSAELKFEYLYNLIAPRAGETSLGVNYNDSDFIKVISENYDVEKNGFIDLSSYIGDVKIEDFKRPELINSYFFKRSLVTFIRNYFAPLDDLPYSLKNFQTEENYIKDNLEGEIKDYALTQLLHDYYKKGLGQGKTDNKYVKNYIKRHKVNITNSKNRETFSVIERDLEMKNFGFDEGALVEKLLTIKGDTLTMGDVLKKTANRIKVFDFWATWCSPCISEIEETTEFRKILYSKYNIEWILVSVDSDQEKWKVTSKGLKPFMNTGHQYRIINLKNSQIVNSLLGGTTNKFSIPRYVIVGPEGKIEVFAAPKPSDTLLFKRVIDKIIE